LRHHAVLFPLLAASVLTAASTAFAVTVGGVDTEALLTRLNAGAVAASQDVLALTAVDIETLTLTELAALLAVLEALRAADYDVAAKVVAVTDQIAFLEAVAEDRPTPASPS